MLHQQADDGDAHPAAGTQHDGLAARFDQLDDVAVEADGGHGHDDHEFRQFLQRGKGCGGDAEMDADRRDDGGDDKIKDEHREGTAEAEAAGLIFFAAVVFGPGLIQREHQCNRNDREGPRQLNRHGLVEGLRAEVPHAVPGRRRRCD